MDEALKRQIIAANPQIDLDEVERFLRAVADLKAVAGENENGANYSLDTPSSTRKADQQVILHLGQARKFG